MYSSHSEQLSLVRRILNRLMRPVQQYWNTDHVLEGRIVELLGNKVRIDGALVDVSDPIIPTKDKASLLKRTYEGPERLLLKTMPYDYPVVELGANIGVLACIINPLLADPNKHMVIEANPDVIPILLHNRDLNHAQFQVKNVALAYNTDEITFYVADKLVASSLHQTTGRPIRVAALTLSQLAENAQFSCFNVICDIEGAEIDMVKHDITLIRECVPFLLLEHHPSLVGVESTREMHQTLINAGFQVRAAKHKSVCYANPKFPTS